MYMWPYGAILDHMGMCVPYHTILDNMGKYAPLSVHMVPSFTVKGKDGGYPDGRLHCYWLPDRSS